MRRKRMLLLFALVAVLFGSLFIRFGYRPLGWGGYIYVHVVNPWKH